MQLFLVIKGVKDYGSGGRTGGLALEEWQTEKMMGRENDVHPAGLEQQREMP